MEPCVYLCISYIVPILHKWVIHNYWNYRCLKYNTLCLVLYLYYIWSVQNFHVC